MNPHVFFVGCARSGTTLLERIGDAHPDLAITPELAWIAAWWKDRVGLSPEGNVLPEFSSHLASWDFDKLEITKAELDELIATGPHRYADFITMLFDRYGERRGKPFVGDKSPRFVRFLPTLHELWPRAKVVHIIRDGRDVCLSVQEWTAKPMYSTWETDPVATAALWWEWNVRLGREAGQVLGDRQYMELRYESLVSDPEGECEKLCAFLGLPYDEAMLRFHEGRFDEGRIRARPNLSAKSAWLPVTAGLRSWANDMPSEDAARFERLAGGFLEELGYPLSGPTDGAGAMERVRHVFEQEVLGRGGELPRAWMPRSEDRG